MPRKSLRQTILGDVKYALEKLLMLRAEHRQLVEGILDKHMHLEAIEEECREMFVIADLVRGAGQESAVDDFLDDYLSNTQMELRKSLLKLAVHASQKYYLSDRIMIPRSQEQFWLLMGHYKNHNSQLFRNKLRVTPETFDALVNVLEKADVFLQLDTMRNGCLSVEKHVAIALYRFGHYGNRASIEEVAAWAGVSAGTVENATNRVMSAIFSSGVRQAAIRWPTGEEKEVYKAWVEDRTCPAWRNGWCFIDGTMIPLYSKPNYYGDRFFDRKHNYSFNIQVSWFKVAHIVHLLSN
ncbi:hypothetical protein V1524DRAFT_24399 [Lipomyces starkeyi]